MNCEDKIVDDDVRDDDFANIPRPDTIDNAACDNVHDRTLSHIKLIWSNCHKERTLTIWMDIDIDRSARLDGLEELGRLEPGLKFSLGPTTRVTP